MKRVLLKLSGEALAGEKKTGFDEATVIEVAKQIRTIAEEGLEIGIVIGGGNFWRGRTSETIDRNKADQIGMLATVMNCIYVSDICRYLGLKTEIFTPFVCGAFTSLYSKDAVEASFAQGKIVFFAGGTGHPYFSTDTATVLRAVEIEAEAILLAKAVDGIYDSDPKTNPNAVKYDEISIEEVVAKKSKAELLEERIAASQKRLEQLKQKKKLLERKQKAAMSGKARKEDSRRKILIGSMLLAKIGEDAAAQAQLREQLDAYLTRDDERALFELPPLAAEEKTSAAGNRL